MPLILSLAMAYASQNDTCNPSAQEMEAGRTQGQDYAWLSEEFEMTVNYMEPCLKEGKKGLGNRKEEKDR